MEIGVTPGIIAEKLASAHSDDRRALRKALLERRRALPASEWERHSGHICSLLQTCFPQLSGMRVGFFWPLNNEPDLRPLIERWAKEGREGFSAMLPVVVEKNGALAFRRWSRDADMVTDVHGIPVPAVDDFLIPEALLIPLVGFDAAGYRIGYGGGYFDRTLALLSPRPLTVGVGFELARIESIFPKPHDQRLDAIITEAGVFRQSTPL